MGIARTPEEKLVTDPQVLERVCGQARAGGGRVVLAMGAFDLLHRGHVAFLYEVAALGDLLVIGVNDDASIRTNKGQDRPILPERVRSYVVAGVGCVDLVCTFHSGEELVERIKPTILVVSPSSHYGIERRASQMKTVRDHGGSVVVFEVANDLHTTDIVRKIRGT